MKRFLDFLTSLKLTVACLVFAMILVFVGTLAQVKIGLWVAQEEYFRSAVIFWDFNTGPVKNGDVILEVDGQPVSLAEEVQNAILKHEPSEQVSLKLLREGELETLEISVSKLIAESNLGQAATSEAPARHLIRVDLGLKRVGPTEAADRNMESPAGVLINAIPESSELSVPVLPGGYAIGTVLLVNLIAAHIRRFKWSSKKTGILLTHVGLILLLLGQLLTELFQVESHMRIEEGTRRNYSESHLRNELSLVDKSQPDQDKVVVFPESQLRKQRLLQNDALPFEVRVVRYAMNTEPMRGGGSDPALLSSDQGLGTRLQLAEKKPTYKMDDRNIPAAVVEIVTAKGSVGQFLVTPWSSDVTLRRLIRQQFGPTFANLNEPQTFEVDGHLWEVDFRFERHYKPYDIELLDFTHDRYKGTEVPKNFSSRVRLVNESEKESREVLIYMNNPLRYKGETYYQGGFEPGDTVSVLQVVRNPAWLTPYISCSLVGAGLLVQFLMHLGGFTRRQRQKTQG